MNEMMIILEKLGVSDAAREKAALKCMGNQDEMTLLLLACLAGYDDRHEYLE